MKKCLIIGENQVSREYIADIIEQIGFEAIHVSNEIEAYLLIKSVDIILLHQYMSVVNSIDYLEIINDLDDEERLTVLVYGREKSDNYINQMLKAGGSGFIYEPITKDSLEENFKDLGLL